MTSAAHRIEHVGDRPSWDCRACGLPWPCADAKDQLLAQFQESPSVLSVFMSSLMSEAFDDLTAHGAHSPPPGLYDRFLGWMRPPRPD